MHKNKPIYVTMPSLAPIEEYTSILQEAWNTGVLTHNGPLVQRLEKEVNNYLNLESTIAVTNGTIALQLAIKALGLRGEIITTPFSWIATSSAIRWQDCEPVFVDINPKTLNIDPQKIEDAITHRTTAIMPVHVFSNPCEIEAIDQIAKKYNLKVIYDAAHAFGVDVNGQSVLKNGDISCTSWHATKLFNTGEGGACFTEDRSLYNRLRRMRFFGHDESKEIIDDGCNGKMTEVHAAMGLANLKYLDGVRDKRRKIFELYHKKLRSLDFISFQKFDESCYNYSYMPIIFDTEERCLRALNKLGKKSIYARRYFYPSLNTIKSVKAYSQMENSEDISKRIVCLPSYNLIEEQEILNIVNVILSL